MHNKTTSTCAHLENRITTRNSNLPKNKQTTVINALTFPANSALPYIDSSNPAVINLTFSVIITGDKLCHGINQAMV